MNQVSAIMVSTIILMIIVFGILIGILVWVYKDAKHIGANAWLWVLIVALFNTSFIGLILYFLIGRKEVKSICTSCGSSIQSSAKYCNVCGVNLNFEKKKLKSAKPVIILVILLICIIIIGAISIVTVGIKNFAGEEIFTQEYGDNLINDTFESELSGLNYEAGVLETSIGNKWKYTASRLNSIKTKTYKIKEDKYTLNVAGSVSDGKLFMEIPGFNEVIEITAGKDKEVIINMSDYINEEIEVSVWGKNAGDVNFKITLE